MPVKIDVTIELNATLQRILKIEIDNIGEPIIRAIADDSVLPHLREYPPASGKKQPFKSAKQRKYFFAALRSGKMRIPYPRSGSLARNWKLSSIGGMRTITGRITNPRPYDKFVQGDDGDQAGYHAGNWRTVTDIAMISESQEAGAIAESIINQELNGP